MLYSVRSECFYENIDEPKEERAVIRLKENPPTSQALTSLRPSLCVDTGPRLNDASNVLFS